MPRFALIALFIFGCDDDPGSGADLSVGLHESTSRITSDSGGLARIEVDATGGVDAFLVTGESDFYLAVDSIDNPAGIQVFHWEDWYGGDENLTWALYPMAGDVALNWPVREAEGPLLEGTWTVWLATINSNGRYAGNADVDLTVQRKVDPVLDDGTVEVLIAWAEGVGDNADVVDATELAVERWAQVWGAYGLGIEVTYVDADVDDNLEYPIDDDVDYGDVSALGTDRDITVVIGETIEGGATYYGIAGGIPGALTAVPRSAIAISWLANSGADGVFSDDDIRLFGETLAHEAGHYVGLFHPVETTYDMYDALEDTERCTSASRCESALGDNLMFPYPICSMLSCDPQEELTTEQEGVAQRYTGTL